MKKTNVDGSIFVITHHLSGIESNIKHYERRPMNVSEDDRLKTLEDLYESRNNHLYAIEILKKYGKEGGAPVGYFDKDTVIAAMEFAAQAVVSGCMKPMSEILSEFTAEEQELPFIAAAADSLTSKYRELVYPYSGSGMLTNTESEEVIRMNSRKCAIFELQSRLNTISAITTEKVWVVSAFSGERIPIKDEETALRKMLKYLESCK